MEFQVKKGGGLALIQLITNLSSTSGLSDYTNSANVVVGSLST